MNAEIITIGDEILIGQVVDTNSAWIAQQMNLIGIKISQITSISDKRQHILETLTKAENNADIILITGGLGPTKDDITKLTLCEYFNTKLVMNQEVLEDVKRLILPRYRTMNELNTKQAEVPENCTVIRNPIGTAPILWFEKNKKVFVAMPGVPFEMKNIMQNEILPRIAARFETPAILHKTILTTGVGESFLAERIEKWENELPSNISLAYLPSPGVVRLRLSATGENKDMLESQVNNQVESVKALISEYIFGYDEETLEGTIGKLLLKNKRTLSTAESCTGGNIARLITSIPGCSDYFIGSVVAYSNRIKEKILYVNPNDIKTYGAVNQQVVEQMASNVKALYQTDFALATSGIAGPDGGSPEKPVGTVWIAVATPDRVFSEKYLFGENRDRNIIRASITALNMLRKSLNQ